MKLCTCIIQCNLWRDSSNLTDDDHISHDDAEHRQCYLQVDVEEAAREGHRSIVELSEEEIDLKMIKIGKY
jgi:hypothetical protein